MERDKQRDEISWVEQEQEQAQEQPNNDGVVHNGDDDEKRLLMKIDLHLMGTLWVLYLFSYMVCDSLLVVKLWPFH